MPAPLDYHWILAGKLAQGAYPKPPIEAFGPFDVVVFCAEELQPRLHALPRTKKAVYVPLDDNPYQPVSAADAKRVREIGAVLAKDILAGRRVLVTCAMGANRSGLVTGMTLRALGHHGPAAVELIRARRIIEGGRQKALFNPVFAAFVTAAAA
jgi:protein-tyrosine phosphatase